MAEDNKPEDEGAIETWIEKHSPEGNFFGVLEMFVGENVAEECTPKDFRETATVASSHPKIKYRSWETQTDHGAAQQPSRQRIQSSVTLQ